MKKILEIINLLLSFIIKSSYKVTSIFFPKNQVSLGRKLYYMVAMLFCGAIFVLLFGFLSINYKKVFSLKDYQPSIPTIIYDRNGKEISKLFREYRIVVPSSKITEKLKQAFIAIEDNHFYTHFGIDVQSILRAFLINLQYRDIKQGGSTITQQLAKLVLTSRERSYIRKLKEALIAVYIETAFSKEDILGLYLNQIYFGHGNYGVQAASLFYFNKPIEKLHTGEMALLASLPSAPNGYSPFKNPTRSIKRVQLVLLKMIDAGFITPKEAIDSFQKMTAFYRNLNIASSATAFGERLNKAPFFTELIRKRLQKRFDSETIYRGGLKIHTSLDLRHQKAAQNSLWKSLEEYNQEFKKTSLRNNLKFSKQYANLVDMAHLLFGIPPLKKKIPYKQYESLLYFYQNIADKAEILNFAIGLEPKLGNLLNQFQSNNIFNSVGRNRIEGALVELDNITGEVTAMVGGSPFSPKNQINRTIQIRRQPGSTIKPLIYAIAIDSGKVQASSIFSDTPLFFIEEDSREWLPENYGGDYSGFVSVREALKKSINSISISIALEVGTKNITPHLSKMIENDESKIPKNLTIALGSHEMSPIQVAKSFAIFPRGGKNLPTVIIKKIEDSKGEIIYEYKPPEPEQIIKKGTATIINSFLEDVIEDGTGKSIRNRGVSWFVAGKTGTTQNYKDAWFAGYNKRYTSVVWVGYDRSSTSLGAGKSGSSVAAPIWTEFQKKVYPSIRNEEKQLDFEGVTTLTICTNYNKQPGRYCQKTCLETYEEIFVIDNELPEECTEELYNTSSLEESRIINDNIDNNDFELDLQEDSL